MLILGWIWKHYFFSLLVTTVNSVARYSGGIAGRSFKIGRPVLKEAIDKFKTKQKQLEEAANEIQREREKDRERKRLGLGAEECEEAEMETEDPNRVA